MQRPRTVYAIREYTEKGEKKSSFVPAGQLWQMPNGKIEWRVDLPGFAAGQLIVFRADEGEPE